jgi:YVTN family beta-propeller protein
MKRFLSVMLATIILTAAPSFSQIFKVTQRVKFGGEGGWDYLTYDQDGRRLFITRGDHVMVVDSGTLKVTFDILGLSGIHAVALAPQFSRGFISNGGDNTVTVFDLKSLKKLDSVKVGERPDAMLYEPFTRHVFTFNARTHDSTVIDAATGKVLATIPLGGKPEFAVSDGKGKVYVNIEDKNQMAQVDATKNTVLKTWPIDPCQDPSALAIDIAHHRLFAGCDNKMLAVVDSDSGNVVTTVPIGEGVDAGSFNPKTQQVLMACGEGVLTIIHEDSPDKYTVTQNIATMKGARTMALDESNSLVYLVTAQREDKPAAPGKRPAMVPGSFELIVASPQ